MLLLSDIVICDFSHMKCGLDWDNILFFVIINPNCIPYLHALAFSIYPNGVYHMVL